MTLYLVRFARDTVFPWPDVTEKLDVGKPELKLDLDRATVVVESPDGMSKTDVIKLAFAKLANANPHLPLLLKWD